MKYVYTVKTNENDGSIGDEGFETDNFDAAMFMLNAIEKSGTKATLSTRLA